LPQQCLTYSVP